MLAAIWALLGRRFMEAMEAATALGCVAVCDTAGAPQTGGAAPLFDTISTTEAIDES